MVGLLHLLGVFILLLPQVSVSDEAPSARLVTSPLTQNELELIELQRHFLGFSSYAPPLGTAPVRRHPRDILQNGLFPWTCCRLCPHKHNYPELDQMFGTIRKMDDSVPPAPKMDPGPGEAGGGSGGSSSASSDSFLQTDSTTTSTTNDLKRTHSKHRAKFDFHHHAASRFRAKPKHKWLEGKPRSILRKHPEQWYEEPLEEPDHPPEAPSWSCCNVCPSMATPLLSTMAVDNFLQLSTKLRLSSRSRRHSTGRGLAGAGGEAVLNRGDPPPPKLKFETPTGELEQVFLPPCCDFCVEKYFPQHRYTDIVGIVEPLMAVPPFEVPPRKKKAEFLELDASLSASKRTQRRRRARGKMRASAKSSDSEPQHSDSGISELIQLRKQWPSLFADAEEGDDDSDMEFDEERAVSLIELRHREGHGKKKKTHGPKKKTQDDDGIRGKFVSASGKPPKNKILIGADLYNRAVPPPPPSIVPPDPVPPPAKPECCHRCVRMSTERNRRHHFYWPVGMFKDPDQYKDEEGFQYEGEWGVT